ncbi:MAG: histidine phosphatase family protein [Bacteroidota bacterium]
MKTLHLLRHLPAANAERRAIGHTDLPLADPTAPDRLANAWPHEPPTRLVASPLLRASHTARALSTTWNLEIEHEPRLREMDFGAWDGRSWDEIEQDDAASLHAWMGDWTSTPAPGGESFADVRARVDAWLSEHAADAATDDTSSVVVVAHAGPIRALLVHVLDLDPAHAFRLDVHHGALTTVRLRPPCLTVLNHPLWLPYT